LVKNEQLKLSNEQIIKEVNNKFVTAYLAGKRDVGVNLTSTYWNEFDGEFTSTDCYKIDNIDKDVTDIFIGDIGTYGLPYVFLLMEDNTIEYVDLKCFYDDSFYYEAKHIEGLDDVVGFEQKSRKYSYSDTDYEYVNAIRSDGKRKEIEIGVLNNWDDNVSEEFERLNEKYIKAHNGEAIPDDGKGDFYVDGALYIRVNGESRYLYCYKGEYMHHELYRVEASTGKEKCLISGLDAIVTSNEQGKICVYVKDDNYTVYELDKNVVIKHHDESIITEITNNSNTNNTEVEQLSVFERKVFESGDYYRNKLGHYCLKTSKDSKHAYHIENNKLFRTNIKDDETVSWLATGIDDLYKDGNGNLIAVVQTECSIEEYDINVSYKDSYVTDSPVVETYKNDSIEIYLKADGSLATKVCQGGLQKLGFNPKDVSITEDVLYNTFGSGHGVKNNINNLYYANAKKGILAKAGRNGRLCFAYEKGDGNVIAIDILNAIECGSFTGARTSECYIEGTIEKLYISDFADDKDEDGKSIPKYKTIFVLEKTKNGEEISRHIFMPCEEM
jgi:hypothetical protein